MDSCGVVATLVVRAKRERSHKSRSVRQHVSEMRRRSLVPFSASEKAAVIEHALSERIQGPVVALARIARFSRDLDKTIIQRKVVPYAILPGGKFVPVVGESCHNELADATQCELLLRRVEDRHCDECDIRVRWLDLRRREFVLRDIRDTVLGFWHETEPFGHLLFESLHTLGHVGGRVGGRGRQ